MERARLHLAGISDPGKLTLAEWDAVLELWADDNAMEAADPMEASRLEAKRNRRGRRIQDRLAGRS